MSRNYLKISHEITKTSVIAGISFGIVPLHMSMRLSLVKNKIVYLGIFKYIIAVRPELGYRIASC